ncbi:Telomerase Cajal body protein 1, partial [Perkinsus olseni]
DVDLLLAAIRNLMKQNNARKFIWMQPSRDPIANAKAMHCFKENHHSVTTVGPDLYVVDLTSPGEKQPAATDEPEAQGTPVVVPEEVHNADESEAVKQGAKRSREATGEDDTESMKRSRARRASVYPGMESYNAAVFTAFEGCAVRSADDVDGEKSPTSEDANDEQRRAARGPLAEQWASQHGIQLHPAVSWFHATNGMIGCTATADIGQGERLLYVPHTSCVTPSGVHGLYEPQVMLAASLVKY